MAKCDFKLCGRLNVWSHSPHANCLSFDSGMGDADGGDVDIMGRALDSDNCVSFSQSAEERDDEWIGGSFVDNEGPDELFCKIEANGEEEEGRCEEETWSWLLSSDGIEAS